MPQVYFPDEDTIAAMATSPGEGGIAVIRISGSDAISILEKVFKREGEKNIKDMKSHRFYKGHIVGTNSTVVIDSVLCVLMKSPHSYTGEDVAEIHCHGGYLVPKKILNLLFIHGVRPARPGEFTLRAFMNGRMDLAQAEAVADVVKAQTDESLKQAELQLEGVLSSRIHEFKEIVLDALAEIEAQVDFPEEDIDPIIREEIIQRISGLINLMNVLLSTFEGGRILKDGVCIAIIGKPNVGKSSLLNHLLMKERAIVTPTPGTTRDFIEEAIDIRGIPIRLVDTAGLRVTADEVEKLGVVLANKKADEAELIIALVDGSAPLDNDDLEVLNRIKNRRAVLAINKSDLTQRISEITLFNFILKDKTVKTSAKLGSGIEELKDLIRDVLIENKKSLESTELIISELRHKVAIQTAKDNLTEFLKAFKKGESPEFLAVSLRSSLTSLGEITGETTTEYILGRIFSKFCIGK